MAAEATTGNSTRMLLAVSVIALILGAVSLGFTISVQAGISSISTDVGQAKGNLKLLAEATGVPLGNQEQLQKIIAAKKDGAVVVYGSLEEDIMKRVEAAFERKYGVDLQYWRASSTGVLDRVLTEVKAANPQFDVVLTNRAPMNIMKAGGSFGKYTSPEAANFPDKAKDPDGVLQPLYRAVVVSILYNTKLVKPEEAPRTLEELLDPKWKGKIVLPDPAQHTTTTQWLFNLQKLLGPNYELFIKSLSKQEPRLVRSFIPSAETVIKGEKALGITYVKYVKVYEPAPIDYVRLPVLLADVHSLAIGAKAKHPNAAKLFTDFFISREGLAIIAEAGEFVAVPGVFPPIKDADKLNIVYMDELTEAQFKEFATTFNKWLTQG